MCGRVKHLESLILHMVCHDNVETTEASGTRLSYKAIQ